MWFKIFMLILAIFCLLGFISQCKSNNENVSRYYSIQLDKYSWPDNPVVVDTTPDNVGFFVIWFIIWAVPVGVAALIKIALKKEQKKPAP